jgi:hypothetical protein
MIWINFLISYVLKKNSNYGFQQLSLWNKHYFYIR